jgi:AAA15 family ATPase/GTPase
MLLQYSVQNFLSFKDEVTLSLLASKRRSKNRALDASAVFEASPELRLLKCAVIYGANNSGKSNLIKSMGVLKQLVLNSSRESQASESIKVAPFLLNPETVGKASSFEIIFVQEGFLYQYELSANSVNVEKERLTRKALAKNATPVELFVREGDEIKLGRSFKEGKDLQRKTRSNALFLSVCANFDGPISGIVLGWFSRLRIVSGLNDTGLTFTASKLEEPEIGARIQRLLKVFDLGIDRYEQGEEIPGLEISTDTSALPPEALPIAAFLKGLKRRPSHKVISYHKMFTDQGEYAGDVAFDLSANESQGTKKLVALAGPLVDTFDNARVLVIDEFESRLHPNICKTILGMFNSSELNTSGAQLIAATHDTNLLDGDLLRRDQIWFAGRDKFGRSSLTSLIEYKVRNDASFEKNYLAGDYGGVPFLRPTPAVTERTAADKKLSTKDKLRAH